MSGARLKRCAGSADSCSVDDSASIKLDLTYRETVVLRGLVGRALAYPLADRIDTETLDELHKCDAAISAGLAVAKSRGTAE